MIKKRYNCIKNQIILLTNLELKVTKRLDEFCNNNNLKMTIEHVRDAALNKEDKLSLTSAIFRFE